MNLGLKDKVAIVTGGSAGLGRAIACALAGEGARIAICGRRQAVLEQTADQILQETGARMLTFAGDMTCRETAAAFIESVIVRWGHVHILVNNVGQATCGFLESLTPVLWQKTFETNLLSAIHVTRAVIPFMKARQWGRVINISALSGKEPGEALIASNVVKAGLISFSKTLSRELAPDNILVNCVSPGLIDSPQNDRYFSPPEREEAIRKIPLGRFGRPREFADAVAFLCSERASYITGVNLLIDGGTSRGL